MLLHVIILISLREISISELSRFTKMASLREGIQFHKEFSVDELPLKATIDTLRPTDLFNESW